MKRLSYPYIAGLFDGEGNIEITNKLALRLGFANTHKPVLLQLRRQLGGSFCVVSNKPNPNWKIGYQLRLSGKQGRELLARLLPYLVIKKDRAITALKLHPVPSGQRIPPREKAHRQRLRKRLQELNRRGKYSKEE